MTRHNRRHRLGFTLQELLIAIGIMMVLSAFSMTAILGYMRGLQITELDTSAREMLVVAQNHFTRLKTTGQWTSLVEAKTGQSESFDALEDAGYFGVKMTVKPADYDAAVAADSSLESWDEAKDHMYYLVHETKSTSDNLLQNILPTGSLESTALEEGAYVIEYNAKTASVYGVFYTDKNTFNKDVTAFNYDAAKALDEQGGRPTGTDDSTVSAAKKVRRTFKYSGKTMMTGYFGGALISTLEGADNLATALTVYNEEQLILKITDGDADCLKNKAYTIDVIGLESNKTQRFTISNFNNTNIVMQGEDLSAGTVTTMTNVITSTDNSAYYVILDDLTTSGMRFADLCPSLTPGENVAIKVSSYDTSTISATYVRDVSVNSLFATSAVETNGDTSYQQVSLRYLRHLENLSPAVSSISDGTSEQNALKIHARMDADIDYTGVTSTTTAQTSLSDADIDALGLNSDDAWADFYAATGKEIYLADGSTRGSYVPVYNPRVNLFDGENHLITNLAINSLDDDRDGAGLFSVFSGTLQNVGVVNGTFTGAYSMGALAAVLDTYNGNTTIQNAWASVKMTSVRSSDTSEQSVGGLVGKINEAAIGTVTIKNSYSGGFTENAVYVDANVQAIGDNYNVGGLIGAIANNTGVTIANCYTTSSVAAYTGANSTSGGFVGKLTNPYASISNSYAANAVMSDSGTKNYFGPYGVASFTNVYFLNGTATLTGASDAALAADGNTLAALTGYANLSVDVTYNEDEALNNRPYPYSDVTGLGHHYADWVEVETYALAYRDMTRTDPAWGWYIMDFEGNVLDGDDLGGYKAMNYDVYNANKAKNYIDNDKAEYGILTTVNRLATLKMDLAFDLTLGDPEKTGLTKDGEALYFFPIIEKADTVSIKTKATDAKIHKITRGTNTLTFNTDFAKAIWKDSKPSVYTVRTAKQMFNMNRQTYMNDSGFSAEAKMNIDLSVVPQSNVLWQSDDAVIGYRYNSNHSSKARQMSFAGIYDGSSDEGYTHDNLAITASDNDTLCYGLFAMSKGTLKNIRLSGDIKMSGGCSTLIDTRTGLLIGINNGAITDCDASGAISVNVTKAMENADEGARLVGGLVGRNNNAVTNCTADVDITQSGKQGYGLFAGGFVGTDAAKITNCTATGDIKVTNLTTASIFGGFAARTYEAKAQITTCEASGDITMSAGHANTYIGGFIGMINGNDDVLMQCAYNGTITYSEKVSDKTSDSFIGGFAGQVNNGAIKRSYARAKFAASDTNDDRHVYVGGFSGQVMDTVVKIQNACASSLFSGTPDQRVALFNAREEGTSERTYMKVYAVERSTGENETQVIVSDEPFIYSADEGFAIAKSGHDCDSDGYPTSTNVYTLTTNNKYFNSDTVTLNTRRYVTISQWCDWLKGKGDHSYYFDTNTNVCDSRDDTIIWTNNFVSSSASSYNKPRSDSYNPTLTWDEDEIKDVLKADITMFMIGSGTDDDDTTGFAGKIKSVSGYAKADSFTLGTEAGLKQAIEDGKVKDVSCGLSKYGIYVWVDDGVMYWWSYALAVDEPVYLNDDSSGMFEGTRFTNVTLSDVDTTKCTSMDDFFKNMDNVELIDMSGVDMSTVPSASGMFDGVQTVGQIETPVNNPLDVALPYKMYDLNDTDSSYTSLPQKDKSHTLVADLKYTVRFDGGGADGGSMSDMSCTINKTYTIPECGYTYTNKVFEYFKDSSGNKYYAGDEFKNLTERTKTITLTAVWRDAKYTIHFEGDGADSGSMSDMECLVGEEYQIPDCGFEYTDKVFSHYVDEDGNIYDALDTVKDLAEDGETITLTCVWLEVPKNYKLYVITHSYNGWKWETNRFYLDLEDATYVYSSGFNYKDIWGTHWVYGWTTERDGSGEVYGTKGYYDYEYGNYILHYPYQVIPARVLIDIATKQSDGTYTVHLYAQYDEAYSNGYKYYYSHK